MELPCGGVTFWRRPCSHVPWLRGQPTTGREQNIIFPIRTAFIIISASVVHHKDNSVKGAWLTFPHVAPQSGPTLPSKPLHPHFFAFSLPPFIFILHPLLLYVLPSLLPSHLISPLQELHPTRSSPSPYLLYTSIFYVYPFHLLPPFTSTLL